MANIKSALKRIEVTERNRLHNRSYKSAVKTLSKRYLATVEAYHADPNPDSLAAATASIAVAYSKIDKAIKRGVLHPNTGARKKSRLARVLKTVEAQVSPSPSQDG
ncbi:MAG: 30S ribosomal protein S20 [Nodosilinea sp. LVE1205-7]